MSPTDGDQRADPPATAGASDPPGPPTAAFEAPEVPARPERPPSLARRLTRPRSILSIIVAVALLSFSLWRLGPETLRATWAQIQQTNPLLYVAAIAVYYTAFPIRGGRWRILLGNAGVGPGQMPRLGDLAQIIYLSWFVNALTPAKLGDLYRGWLLRKTSGIPWALSMGTIVAERLLDVIVLVALMIATGFVAYRELLTGNGLQRITCNLGLPVAELGPTLLRIFLAGGVALFILVTGLAVFARFGAHLERFLPTRLGKIYVRFASGLVYSFGRFGALLGLSLVAWTVEAGRFWLVGAAMGQQLPLPVAFFFALVSAFLTTIPVTPGGVGFEIILAAALCLLGYAPSDAWALALVDRSISYLSLVLGGAGVYVWSPLTK